MRWKSQTGRLGDLVLGADYWVLSAKNMIKITGETKGDEHLRVGACVSCDLLSGPRGGGQRCVCLHNRAANRPIRDERVWMEPIKDGPSGRPLPHRQQHLGLGPAGSTTPLSWIHTHRSTVCPTAAACSHTQYLLLDKRGSFTHGCAYAKHAVKKLGAQILNVANKHTITLKRKDPICDVFICIWM